MKRRVLGRTGLEVSVMGMGTGGHDPLGQRSGRPEREMVALLHRAFELGITHFDTSPGYLESERILGSALGSLSRDAVTVSTKVALAGGHSDSVVVMKPREVRESVESSLQNLDTDYIDIILMAVAGPEFFDTVMNDHVPVLEALKQEGKVRCIGSSEQTRSDGSHEWLQRVLPTQVLDVAMVGHNMINQSAQDTVFPFCKTHNIGVINIFTVRNLFWNPERLREVVADLVDRELVEPDALPENQPLGWLTDGTGVSSLVEAAYRYALHTEPVTTVMCGTLEQDELEENVATTEKPPLPGELRSRLKQLFGGIAEPIGN